MKFVATGSTPQFITPSIAPDSRGTRYEATVSTRLSIIPSSGQVGPGIRSYKQRAADNRDFGQGPFSAAVSYI